MQRSWRLLKKLPGPPGENPCAARSRHRRRGVVPGRDARGAEEQSHLSLGQDRLTATRRPRPPHSIDLPVRCSLPRAWNRLSPRAAGLQHRSHAASPRRHHNQGQPRRSRRSPARSGRLAWRRSSPRAKQHLAPAAAVALARTQRPRKHLAVHASELALKPHLQRLRRHRRSLLLCLEHTPRPALENHVRRPPRLGSHASAIVRIGIKQILDRVLSWPPERQADVVHVVEIMEEQDNSTLRLTDEQLAEVRRRRAKKNPKYVSLAEARKRFRDRDG